MPLVKIRKTPWLYSDRSLDNCCDDGKHNMSGFNKEFPLRGGRHATVRRWYLHRVFAAAAAAASSIFSPAPISTHSRKWFLMNPDHHRDQPQTPSLAVSPPASIPFSPFHLSSSIDPGFVGRLCVNNVCRVSAGARCPNLSPANAVDSGVFSFLLMCGNCEKGWVFVLSTPPHHHQAHTTANNWMQTHTQVHKLGMGLNVSFVQVSARWTVEIAFVGHTYWLTYPTTAQLPLKGAAEEEEAWFASRSWAWVAVTGRTFHAISDVMFSPS